MQYVAQMEFSFGLRIEPRRPLLDLFLGPVTLAFGNHPVITDPRANRHHGGRGFVCATEEDMRRDLGEILDARIL